MKFHFYLLEMSKYILIIFYLVYCKFFYDVIYNPKETNFLKMGKKLGHKTENGKLMFIYQAYLAFNIWHKVKPEINDDVLKLLDI